MLPVVVGFAISDPAIREANDQERVRDRPEIETQVAIDRYGHRC
jgi:hypothetical protein